MYRSLYLLAVLLGLFSCSPKSPELSENNNQKGSLFIIGGGNRPPQLVKRMLDESGLNKGGYAVILPMASSIPDSVIIWLTQQFVENGASQVAGINFQSGEVISASKTDSVRNAKLIFISGGDQNRFMEIVGGTAIEQSIREAWEKGAMIAGTSAGAAVMSQFMITGNELRNHEYNETFQTIESDNLELNRGLGFINKSIIDQHFVIRSRYNRLLTAIVEKPDQWGIGIDESTALLVRGNTAEVIGDSQVLVFRNPYKSRFDFNTKLGARNLRIDIYLPGEKFKLN